MYKKIIFLFLVFPGLHTYAQDKKLHQLRVSIPVVWNRSDITYHSPWNRSPVTGTAFSFGINGSFSKTIYKNIYGILGLGYYKQSFGLTRLYNYPDPRDIPYRTNRYHYHSLHYIAGGGFRGKLTKSYSLKGEVTYNYLYSYRQRYSHNDWGSIGLTKRRSMPIGSFLSMNLGVEKRISNNLFLGLDALLPVVSKWKEDTMFPEENYADHPQHIGNNRFSVGTRISVSWRF